jgi:hypothetical protein
MHAREFDLSVAIRILPVNGLVTLWVKPQTVLTEIYFVISGLFNICDKVLVTFTILLELLNFRLLTATFFRVLY